MNIEEYQNLLNFKQESDLDELSCITREIEDYIKNVKNTIFNQYNITIPELEARIQKCNIHCQCCNGVGLIPKYDFIRPYTSTVLIKSETCHICQGLGRILYEL